jgi:septum formation protein
MLHSSTSKKIILGSKSPRRSQLLSEAGFTFEVRVQDVDESFHDEMPVEKVAESLAIRKAEALKNTIKENEIIITADSVVILDNKIYNKPADYDEGVKMLTALAGRKHTVITGVCLLSSDKETSFSVQTLVMFDDMTSTEMDYYLKNYEPYDKAGGYGIQDWIGLCKVKMIEGSYSNVMGLPVRELYLALKEFGVTI